MTSSSGRRYARTLRCTLRCTQHSFKLGVSPPLQLKIELLTHIAADVTYSGEGTLARCGARSFLIACLILECCSFSASDDT